MPIYEYRCQTCSKISSFLTRTVRHPINPRCAHCGQGNVELTISKFAYHKSIQTTRANLDSLQPLSATEYYKDPRNIGRHVEDSFEKLGAEIPDSIRETINAAREGQLPEDLEV